MGANVRQAKDIKFLKLVKSGVWAVTPEGIVTSLVTGRVIGKKPGPDGYHRASFIFRDGKDTILVHRLVHLVHVGGLSNKHVNHIDGDKSNNKKTNLEKCTVGQNNLHAIVSGARKEPRGQSRPNAGFTDSQVRLLRKRYKNGTITIASIASKYGVSWQTAKNMITGVYYSHL